MEPQSAPGHLGGPFPFGPQDWEHTPPAVQAYVYTLHHALTQLRERVEAVEARLQAHSSTSQRPPASDSPSKKPRQRSIAPRRTAGGKPGHPGHRQGLLAPTTVQELRPERCACGHTTLTLLRPSYTPQVLELPPITLDVTHWMYTMLSLVLGSRRYDPSRFLRFGAPRLGRKGGS